MALRASISRGLLSVTGAAARAIDYPVVRIAAHLREVDDNTEPATNVPVADDLSPLTRIDVRGLTGSGVMIDYSGDASLACYGSRNFDEFYLSAGSDTVYGYAGDDWIQAGGGADRLDGGVGADAIWAGTGDDTLTGGAGADLLDGGAGIDTAIFTGARADYDIAVKDGVFVVNDRRAGGGDGVDLVGNIEFLRFTDQHYQVSAPPTAVQASNVGRLLSVKGAAAVSDGYSQVAVDVGGRRVFDNGAVAVEAAIAGAGGPQLVRVDVRGLTGAGANVYGDVAGITYYGSAQDDNFDLSSGGDTVLALDGHDRLSAYGGADSLNGGRGRDLMEGGGGDDTLIGGADDDQLDGGGGVDTAVFIGARADYVIEPLNGAFQVIDLRAGAPDGRDLIGNVEFVRFSDQVVAMPSLSGLSVTIVRGVLKIDGAATQGGSHLRVDLSIDDRLVLDNGEIADEVAVVSDASARIIRVDVRGLTGTGVYADYFGVSGLGGLGSAQGDTFVLGAGADTLFGYGGDDDLYGRSGADRLDGGPGADTLAGDRGDDLLIGGAGDDTLDGGRGIDTAVFSGRRQDYSLVVEEGLLRVADLRRGSPEGSNLLANMELLRFSDQTVTLTTDGFG